MLEEEGQLACGREEGELWETPACEHGAPFKREGSGYVHVCAFMDTRVPAHAFANSRVHVRAFMDMCVPTRAFANSRVHVHICTHSHVHAYACLCVGVLAHTHVPRVCASVGIPVCMSPCFYGLAP